MATLAGRFVNDSGVVELEGELQTDAPISADLVNGVAINNTPTVANEVLTTVDGSNASWGLQVVRIAAGVPAGAPVQGELPFAFDSTAVTGGLYAWDGAAWVKVSTIP